MFTLVLSFIIGSQMHMLVLDTNMSYTDCHERLTRVTYISSNDPIILTCEGQ